MHTHTHEDCLICKPLLSQLSGLWVNIETPALGNLLSLPMPPRHVIKRPFFVKMRTPAYLSRSNSSEEPPTVYQLLVGSGGVNRGTLPSNTGVRADYYMDPPLHSSSRSSPAGTPLNTGQRQLACVIWRSLPQGCLQESSRPQSTGHTAVCAPR